jgi:hypothetical protein
LVAERGGSDIVVVCMLVPVAGRADAIVSAAGRVGDRETNLYRRCLALPLSVTRPIQPRYTYGQFQHLDASPCG